MTIKRINSTGRKRILREDARVSIEELSDGSLSFTARLNLLEYALPLNALVFIEAYRQSTLMRFPFGTVDDPRPSQPPILAEFRQPDGLLFRVKIINAATQHGMLLAEGEIPVSNDKERPEDRIALLPPRAGNLGSEIWRLDFTTSPELVVNEKLPDWKGMVQTLQFRSFVFPVAIRQVLERIYWSQDSPAVDDESSWSYNWVRFAESIPGIEKCPPTGEENELEWTEWVNSVCERFADQHEFLNAISDQPLGDN